MRRGPGKVLTWIYVAALMAFTVYAALDIFVIPRSIMTVRAQTSEAVSSETVALTVTTKEAEESLQVSQTQETESLQEAATDGDAAESLQVSQTQEWLDIPGEVIGSYEEGGIRIRLTKMRAYESDVYIADVILSSPEQLKTAFAYDTYGKNVKQETSEIAEANDAILAINGDFYGSRTEGYVLRNGVLYRDRAVAGREDLAILSDGSFLMVKESEVSAQELVSMGATQVFSFGPALLEDGTVMVSETQEVGKAKASNPRTAIGMVGELHYVFVVSDGRTSASEGLSLYELAGLMRSIGVRDAYNLDGGGSSTMVFRGEVINHPTTSGRNTKEREVSDIIYIGR